MTEVSSLLSQSPIDGDAKVLSVTKYTGLHLEPPTRDVVSQTKTAKKRINYWINQMQFAAIKNQSIWTEMLSGNK